MVPAVNIVEVDGALGTLPNGLRPFAVVGPSDSGMLNAPVMLARTTDVITAFGAGPLVEYACYIIELTGRPVICVRAASSVAASMTGLNVAGVTGTSVVTLGADTTPNDDYELYLKVKTGGTIATPGIIFNWSLDGGRNMSDDTALLAANSFAFPNSGGVGFAFAAGTLVAGDVVTAIANAPANNSSDLASALTPLFNYGLTWECAVIASPIGGTELDALETAFANYPERWYLAGFRMPNSGESDATYQAAFSTAFSSKATTRGSVCFGSCEPVSSGPFRGRKYRRGALFAVAPLQYKVSEEIDIAKTSLGALPVSLKDANNNLKHHDEALQPGADNLRATTLRTIDGYGGVYVNNPRLLSTPGSDFQYTQHRRVMILARVALRLYFTFRLSEEILVGSDGYILESEAAEIDEGANAALAQYLLAKPKASAAKFKLSRFDNILSTFTLTGQADITPLAYAKTYNISLGFRNPALKVTQLSG